LGRKIVKTRREQLYNALPELWHVGEVAIEELYFLKEIDYGMLQPKDRVDYLVYFYEHQLGEVLILDEVIDIIVKD
jgi:hypothetical protein